jgi:predicted PurR-regulated permease PerM
MTENRQGISSAQALLLTVLGAIALLLVLANIGLSLNNQQAQAEVNARQQYINQTVEISRLNAQIVQALANLSVQNNDASIRNLLESQGISINFQPEGPSEPEQ